MPSVSAIELSFRRAAVWPATKGWPNATLLAPVRQSFATHQPIVWNRVNALPDYVYFNHGIHLAKGIGCSSCHGDVGRMALTSKTKSFEMSFCLACHRDPAPNLKRTHGNRSAGLHHLVIPRSIGKLEGDTRIPGSPAERTQLPDQLDQ